MIQNLLELRRWCLAVCVVLVGGIAAQNASAEDGLHSPTSAFEVLKSLDGTWQGESTVVPAGQPKEEGTTSNTTVTYKTIAAGTSVIATFAEGTPAEMVSLYHMDGPEKLFHTHYCAVGNQPTMRFADSPEKGLIKFEFDHGSNMDVESDGHVHAGTMKMVDPDTLVTETEVWSGGKLMSMRYAKLHRTK